MFQKLENDIDGDEAIGVGEYHQKERTNSSVQLGSSGVGADADPFANNQQKIPVSKVAKQNNYNYNYNYNYSDNRNHYQNMNYASSYKNNYDVEASIRSNKCLCCLNGLFDIMVLWCCFKRCRLCRCCVCCGPDANNSGGGSSSSNSSGRSMMYTAVTFGYSWMYFVSAMWFVPFIAQMCLNSLATATAVVIFMKRKELSLKDFRILSGIFTPIVIFMSAYAIWSEKESINDEIVNNKLRIN